MFKSMLDRMRQAHAAEAEGGGAAESGFTLIELMVVLLIIAILMAIAIPTFLGVTGSANDRAVQSNLSNALIEASSQYQSAGQTFTGITTVTLQTADPSIQWAAAGAGCASSATNCVSWAIGGAATATDGQAFILAGASKSGACYYVASVQQTPAAGGAWLSTFVSGAPTTEVTAATKAGTFYFKHTASTCTATDLLTSVAITGLTWGSAVSF